VRIKLGILLVLIALVGCAQSSLSVNYNYSTEGSFYDVKIENSNIAYTHLDFEKIRDKCSGWIQQAPCWDVNDLITEEAQLTSEEIRVLQGLSVEAKQLESYYGPAKGQRCYPYVLQVDTKEITYCSRPDGPAQPEAFAQLTLNIEEIVTRTFILS